MSEQSYATQARLLDALGDFPTGNKSQYLILAKHFKIKQVYSDRDWMIRNKEEKPQTYTQYLEHIKNSAINEVLVASLWQDEEHCQKKGDRFTRELLPKINSWLKVFFQERFSVVEIQDRLFQEDPVFVEGGQFEGPPIAFQQERLSLEKLSDSQIVRTRQRKETPGITQYHAGDVVAFVKKKVKIQSNQMILIFTDGDLYPRDGWSFVFGMTEVKQRVCLISTARHDPDFPTNSEEIYSNDERVQVMTYRAFKTATHELCHVLYQTHCHYYECLMNGSNLLKEADLKPFNLCPICLRKLFFYLNNNTQQIAPYLQNQLSFLLKLGNPYFDREIQQLQGILSDLEGSSINPEQTTGVNKDEEYLQSQESQEENSSSNNTVDSQYNSPPADMESLQLETNTSEVRQVTRVPGCLERFCQLILRRGIGLRIGVILHFKALRCQKSSEHIKPEAQVCPDMITSMQQGYLYCPIFTFQYLRNNIKFGTPT